MKTFIEIGTSDFNNLDAFLDCGWRGFFIEPVPKYFESLQEKVKGKNSVCVQTAITNYNGTIKMDVLTPYQEEQWQRGISHVHAEGNPANYSSNLVQRNKDIGNVETIIVPCVTLDFFLEHFNIVEVDFMQIDVEGHELAILEHYSWNVKPKMLKIEHKFIDDSRLTSLLDSNGYKWWMEREDVYAILMK